jgi:hypothetical protein
MVSSLKASDIYPNKQVINSDTLICSTIEQQKKYLQWKISLNECTEISKILTSKVSIQDSIIREHKKLIDLYDGQTLKFVELNKKNDEIQEVMTAKFDAINTAYKKQIKENKKQKFITGFTIGSLNLIIIGLITYIILR